MFTRSVSSGQSLSLRPFLKIHFSFRNRVLKLKHSPFKIRSGTETREKISETGSRLQKCGRISVFGNRTQKSVRDRARRRVALCGARAGRERRKTTNGLEGWGRSLVSLDGLSNVGSLILQCRASVSFLNAPKYRSLRSCCAALPLTQAPRSFAATPVLCAPPTATSIGAGQWRPRQNC